MEGSYEMGSPLGGGAQTARHVAPVTAAARVQRGDRVVITGASGFIGSAVVRAVQARGAAVVAVVEPTADDPHTSRALTRNGPYWISATSTRSGPHARACKVVGVLEAKGLSPWGGDQDDFILLPYTTVMHKIKGVDWLDDIFISATSTDDIDAATQQITALLRQRHKLRADEPDDFNIRHPEDILNARKEATQTFGMMLAATASVALLIGGIGIMNIMMVSVTERTREIGVRMAVGATESDVRGQFLIEAIVLSLMGGGFGIFLGIFASAGLSAMLSWPTSVSIVAIVVAVLFSG